MHVNICMCEHTMNSLWVVVCDECASSKAVTTAPLPNHHSRLFETRPSYSTMMRSVPPQASAACSTALGSFKTATRLHIIHRTKPSNTFVIHCEVFSCPSLTRRKRYPSCRALPQYYHAREARPHVPSRAIAPS